MTQEQIDKDFEYEKEKHINFFLGYYKEQNWSVAEDLVGKGKFEWDVKLEMKAGVYTRIDEKARRKDYGDFCVELIQCIKNKRWGWYFEDCDAILYASWSDRGEQSKLFGELPPSDYPTSLYLIDMKKLHTYVEEYNGKILSAISPEGYGITYNIVLKWEPLLQRGIAEKRI